MLREPTTINVDLASDLGHLLDEASRSPLILEKNGVRYLSSREEAHWPEMSGEEYQRAQ